MSELPDFPRPPRLTRPLPEGGLEAALQGGRQRRTRFAAATGGLLTAVAVLAATLLSVPGAIDGSLQYADPDPSASTAPVPTTRPSNAAPEPGKPVSRPGLPVPGATLPPRDRPARSAAEPIATRAPRQGGGPAPARPSYLEQPTEEEAPQTCRGAPNGQAGPIVYGGSTSCGNGTGDDNSVRRGGTVSGTTPICVGHDAGPAELGYDTGREHDVLVFDEDGDRVFRFSDTVDYEEVAHTRVLGTGRCLRWRGFWDTTLADGSLAPAGRYVVRIVALPSTINGARTKPGESGSSVEFEVLVEP